MTNRRGPRRSGLYCTLPATGNPPFVRSLDTGSPPRLQGRVEGYDFELNSGAGPARPALRHRAFACLLLRPCAFAPFRPCALRSTTMIHDSILATIGSTPVVRINRLAPAGMHVYVKVEAVNPVGSVKDRLALGHHRGRRAPRRCSSRARPWSRRRRATPASRSRMVCAARGYPFVAVMAEAFSVERRKIMRALGAKVILTPAAERATGMVRQRRGARRRSAAGSSPASSRTRRTPPTTARPPAPRSCATSPTGGSTTGSPAGARAAR